MLESAMFQVFKCLENGIILILTDNNTIGTKKITEIDLLGKVYNCYFDLQGVHYDIIELLNGNFLRFHILMES